MGYIFQRLLRLAKVFTYDLLHFDRYRDPIIEEWEEELFAQGHNSAREHTTDRGTRQTQNPHSSSPEVQWAYSVLGLTGNPTIAEIKKAYREKIKQYHPDRRNSATAEQLQYYQYMTSEINRAYTILRKAFDF